MPLIYHFLEKGSKKSSVEEQLIDLFNSYNTCKNEKINKLTKKLDKIKF